MHELDNGQPRHGRVHEARAAPMGGGREGGGPRRGGHGGRRRAGSGDNDCDEL